MFSAAKTWLGEFGKSRRLPVACSWINSGAAGSA